MPESLIFYSWQSDSPDAENRQLILASLEAAAASIRADQTLRVEPVIDRDTAGVPGAPDITATIFEKIDAADVFVCDVSLIGRSTGGRPMPNPNVMLELGYALKGLGWGRVLLVMNEASGRPTDLPFDLRSKRVITYRASEADNTLAAGGVALAGELQAGLKLLYEHGVRSSVEALPATVDTSWKERHAERAGRDFPADLGIRKEAFVALSPRPAALPLPRLLEIADESQVHTFGWPIGIMNRGAAHMTPKPTTDGIVQQFKRDTSYDYWALRNDGSFYLCKSLFERRRIGPGVLFFDIRVVRATEVCLYLTNLYRLMGIPGETSVFIEFRFSGLEGTLLKASDQRPFFDERGPAVEPAVTSSVTTTIDGLRDDTVEVVAALVRPLFVLYDFFELDRNAYRQIVDAYKAGKLG